MATERNSTLQDSGHHETKGGSSVVAAIKYKNNNVSSVPASSGSSVVAAIQNKNKNASKVEKRRQKNNGNGIMTLTPRNQRRLSYESRALNNALNRALAAAAMIGAQGNEDGEKYAEHSKEHSPENSRPSKRRTSSRRMLPTGRRFNRELVHRVLSRRRTALASAQDMKDCKDGVVFGNENAVSLNMSSGGIRMRPTRRRSTRRASSRSMNKLQFRNLKSLVTFVQKHNSQRVKLLQTVTTPVKVCSH